MSVVKTLITATPDDICPLTLRSTNATNDDYEYFLSSFMTPPTPRLPTIPLPQVHGPPPQYPPWGITPPASSALALDPLLQPSPQHRRLYYDITQPPSTIIFTDPHPALLTRSATTPPTPALHIDVPTTPPWPVIVCNARGVTVFDVFETLYRALRTPVGPSAWDGLTLPRAVEGGSGVVPLRARSHDLPGRTRDVEGRRRVDDLHGRTMFVGLEKGVGGADAWVLLTE